MHEKLKNHNCQTQPLKYCRTVLFLSMSAFSYQVILVQSLILATYPCFILVHILFLLQTGIVGEPPYVTIDYNFELTGAGKIHIFKGLARPDQMNNAKWLFLWEETMVSQQEIWNLNIFYLFYWLQTPRPESLFLLLSLIAPVSSGVVWQKLEIGLNKTISGLLFPRCKICSCPEEGILSNLINSHQSG